jgi:hypothetical protein
MDVHCDCIHFHTVLLSNQRKTDTAKNTLKGRFKGAQA